MFLCDVSGFAHATASCRRTLVELLTHSREIVLEFVKPTHFAICFFLILKMDLFSMT